MRAIIAGSRGAQSADVRRALDLCPWVNFISMVVSGTARGADQEGEKWAAEHGIEILRLAAEWEKHGRRAGPIRNRQMAQTAAALVAVWDGKSPGTKNMVETARKLGLRVFLFRTDTQQGTNWNASGALEDRWQAAEERAGILEFSAGMPRAEAERIAGKLERGEPSAPSTLSD